MRWVHLTIIGLVAAATIIFALQNLGSVTVAFLGFGIHAPVAILVLVIYGLGAVTGGGLFAMLRRSYAGSRRPSSRSA